MGSCAAPFFEKTSVGFLSASGNKAVGRDDGLANAVELYIHPGKMFTGHYFS